MIKTKKKSRVVHAAQNILDYLHLNIQSLNNSKLFAGLMIIILNISSKFVNVKLSKTMEAYLKYTFSRQILIFAIAWMGTRDIYIAFIVSILFMIFMDYLLNEESDFCCLPEAFKDYHINLLETNNNENIGGGDNNNANPNMERVSDDEIKRAEAILEKAKKQNTQLQYQNYQQVKS